MRPSEALNLHREAVRLAVARHHMANPRVFGSIVRGADNDTSDLDLLVDALPGATLFDLGGLHSEVADLLGVEVDIVIARSLRPSIRERILAEARPL